MRTTELASLLRRGTRSHEAWMEALRTLRQSGGYREAIVRDEDLWRVLEDAAAPEDARAGAALVLRDVLDDTGRARVRVAADAVVSPKLRVALDAALTSEESAAEALTELAAEHEENDEPPAARRRLSP